MFLSSGAPKTQPLLDGSRCGLVIDKAIEEKVILEMMVIAHCIGRQRRGEGGGRQRRGEGGGKRGEGREEGRGEGGGKRDEWNGV